MIILPNNTAGLQSTPANIQILFVLHLVAFVAMATCGFVPWLVVRVSDHLHDFRAFLVASTAMVNCVLGTPLVLLGLVSVADSGSWWHGRESCLLGQVLEACVQAGTSWVLVAVVADHWLQYRYPLMYSRFSTRRWVVPLVWGVGCAVGVLAVVSAQGSFYTKESVYDSWMCTPNPENKSFIIITLFMAYVLPMGLTFALYIWLIVKARQVAISQVISIGGSQGKSSLVKEFARAGSSELSIIRQSPYVSSGSSSSSSSRGSPVGSPAMRSVSQPNIKTEPTTQIVHVEERTKERPGSAAPRTPLTLEIHHGSQSQRKSLSLRHLDLPHLETRWLKVPTKLQPLTSPTLDTLEGKVPPWFGRPLSGIPSSAGTYPGISMNHRESVTTEAFPESIPSEIGTDGRSNSMDSQSETIGKESNTRAALSKTNSPTGRKPSADVVTSEGQPTRFLYRRDELPKDGNNWPTVFLTADRLDDYIVATPGLMDERHQVKVSNGRTIKSNETTSDLPSATTPDTVKDTGVGKGPKDLISGLIRRIKVRPINSESSISPSLEPLEDYNELKKLWFLLIPHLLLWLPHYTITTALVANSSFDISFEVFIFIELVGKVAMIINPLLFFLLNGNFRKALVNIFRCRDPNSNIR